MSMVGGRTGRHFREFDPSAFSETQLAADTNMRRIASAPRQQ